MLLQIMPILQILLDKGNVTYNNNNNNNNNNDNNNNDDDDDDDDDDDNNNNKRKRFRLLNSLRAAILDSMTSIRCPIVSNKRTSAFQQ